MHEPYLVILGEPSTRLNAGAEVRPNTYSHVSVKISASLYT